MSQPTSGSEPDTSEHRGNRVILHAGGLLVTFEAAALAAAFLLSVLVLGGCLTIMLLPHDDSSEQAAIALATSIVTAWVTALGGQVMLRR